MLHHRQARIVAVVAVQCREPEELVAADAAARAKAPHHLVVRWRIWPRRKHRDGAGWIECERGRRGLRDPLREGVPGAPGVLAVEERSLAVESITAALGANGGASAGGAHALSFGIAGDSCYLADRSFAYTEAVPSSPGLAAWLRC